MTSTTFRIWIVPSLIMGACVTLCQLLGISGPALLVGWIGGAIAVVQWPGTSFDQ